MLSQLISRLNPTHYQSGFMPRNFVVNVTFNCFSPCQIQVEQTSTVRDLKQTISEKLNVSERLKIPPEELKIIFAGCILQDDAVKLQELCLGNQTVLHAFRDREEKKGVVIGAELPCSESQEPTSVPPSNIYQYFVFCHRCRSLKPGKLRVRCAVCKSGLIVLKRDPEDWDDVLLPGKIWGRCRSEACDKDQFAEFYFKCSGHLSSEEDTVVLKHIRPNRRAVECITCCTVSTPVLVFPCEKGHVICLDCFKNYGIVNLNNRMFVRDALCGYTLPCPDKCENSLIQETHHFCLLGPEQYERYKMFGAMEYVLGAGGVLCPGLNCGQGIMVDDDVVKITCPQGCGFVFCRRCQSEWHDGPCPMRNVMEPPEEAFPISRESEQKARWERESIELIRQTTKPCPKCRANTEKNGGCMHMRCSHCKTEWCWNCEKVWDLECQGNHWFG